MITTVFQTLLDIVGFREDNVLQRLPASKQFRRMLERERARTDRSGDEFSLLLFGVRDWRSGRVTLRYLTRLFGQRLRITDEAGWLDSRHLGVILPSTPGWGAWTLADDLCLRFPEHVPLPECRVFVYPSHWPSEPTDIRRADTQTNEAQDAQPSEGRRAIGSMTAQFVRRLPMWKRVLDVLGASVGLVLLLPLFVAVVLSIKLTSKGPVFFTQMRSGRGGKPFRMLKFRTMVTDAEAKKQSLQILNERQGPAFKIKDDPRVLTVGRWLRTTSLDELPQLWNVLKGDMSLVGPRPLPCDESEACLGWRSRRLDVTPGLTCTWQVRDRSEVSFDDWMRMDAAYARKQSFWRDLRLLVETVPAVVLGKNH